MSSIIWTPESGHEQRSVIVPEVRGISWNNLLTNEDSYGVKWKTAADIQITPEKALASTVMLACSRILSEMISSMDLNLYRRLPGGAKELALESPLHRVIHRVPNDWQTQMEFVEQIVMHLALWGNSYTEIVPGEYGAVSRLNNLHPSRMQVERIENGRLRYRYNNPQTGRDDRYTQDQIMHVRWTPEPDGIKGMVPVEISRDAIALARALEIHASKFWANSARPGVVLQTDGSLTPETAERLRDNWERIHKGAERAYKTAILTNGLKVEPIGFSNESSQFESSRRFQTEEICRIYRLPLHLVQGEALSGDIEAKGQDFLTYTLTPWLRRIEQAISRSLIVNDDMYVAAFDTKSLLRGNSNSRASFYSTMTGLGIYTINDCRRMEGLPPVENGDKHFVAMNTQTLEEAVKPKPDPSQMPGAPPQAQGGVPSQPGVAKLEAPQEAEQGQASQPQYEEAEEQQYEEAEEQFRAYCPTGKDGGRDNSCSSKPTIGINVNDKEQDFTVQILAGIKTTETRITDSLRPYVGKTVGIVRTGKGKATLVGTMKIGEPKFYKSAKEFDADFDKHQVAKDSSHYIGKDGKYGYPITEVKKVKPVTLDTKGIVARIVKRSLGGETVEYHIEFRAYCPTGPGGGLDNSCGASEKFSPTSDDNATHISIPDEKALGEALAKHKIDKLGGHRELAAGTKVALRIDIPAFTSKGVYAVTVHEHTGGKSVGKALGYDSVVRLMGPVSFVSDEPGAEKINKGANKYPLATVKGAFDPDRSIPGDINKWVPVGFNPKKAAYFYDKKTGQEVIAGTDSISVGNSVFVKTAAYGPRHVQKQFRSGSSWGIESRAFCPTGEDGGVDNSCSSDDDGPSASPSPSGKSSAKQHLPDVSKDDNGDGVTDAARVGVPAMEVPPPPGLGRLPNLDPHERAVEDAFAKHFEDDPDGVSSSFLSIVRKSGEPPTFGTDDAKCLTDAWSDSDPERRAENRATLNTPLHQAANAICKRAFVQHLDTLAKGDEIMVTVGGCGAGKGFALKNNAIAMAAKSRSKAVWDSAGDQNATENPWILAEAEKRGLKVTFVYVHADPNTQWADPNRGVVKRAADPKDGRMVDAKVFADSYAIGARNHDAFHRANKDNESASFIFLDNTGAPKQIDGVPKQSLSIDSDELFRFAVKEVQKDGVPDRVRRGATAGLRIWKGKR